jgi:hypothetical protein
VEANPINKIDPSGNCSGNTPGDNVAEVESHVNLSKSEWLNTYTVAGLAVQCWAQGWDWRQDKNDPDASWGPAQVSYNQTHEAYGSNEKHNNLGDKLRCYILKSNIEATPQCFTEEQIKNCPDITKLFILEPPLKTDDWHDAAILMSRRIKHALDVACINKNGKDVCGDTDRYIIAAMAQNGGGFTGGEVAKLNELLQTNDVAMDWDTFFQTRAEIDTSTQLQRFRDAVNGFAKNWVVPYINKIKVTTLINYQHTH